MKKAFFCILALFICSLFSVQVSAQTPTFVKGDNVAGVAVGIGGSLYSGYSYGSGLSRMPAISVFYEHCIMDKLWDEKSSIGVGGVFGFAQAKYYHSANGWGWKSTNFIIGARGALHYALVDKLDTYTSLMLGFNAVSWKWRGDYQGYGTTSGASGITLLWNVGARYYFTDKIAAFAELGYGFAILNLGVAMKF